MKLVVGLGNPGKKYLGTRHNIGFEVLAELHRRLGSEKPVAKFDSELVQVNIASGQVLLQSPLTYMNLSGRAVGAVLDFYKMSLDDLLVVCDDFNLPLGRLRFRPSGSAGGQNGLKDIIRRVKTDVFSRLRLGVGQPPANWDVSNYVLSRFREDEKVEMERMVTRAADGVLTWVEQGTSVCMNRYNAFPTETSPAKNGSPGKGPQSKASAASESLPNGEKKQPNPPREENKFE